MGTAFGKYIWQLCSVPGGVEQRGIYARKKYGVVWQIRWRKNDTVHRESHACEMPETVAWFGQLWRIGNWRFGTACPTCTAPIENFTGRHFRPGNPCYCSEYPAGESAAS